MSTQEKLTLGVALAATPFGVYQGGQMIAEWHYNNTELEPAEDAVDCVAAMPEVGQTAPADAKCDLDQLTVDYPGATESHTAFVNVDGKITIQSIAEQGLAPLVDMREDAAATLEEVSAGKEDAVHEGGLMAVGIVGGWVLGTLALKKTFSVRAKRAAKKPAVLVPDPSYPKSGLRTIPTTHGDDKQPA